MHKQSGCVLGIDTSNYTTSFSLVEDGRVIANLKAPLPVREGACGLRQSDALFAHIKNTPAIASSLREALEGRPLAAVGVSERPRNLDGSYMPCFLAGLALAEGIAATQGVPLYRFSHQCGHLRAALYSSGMQAWQSRPFGAFHISGGTTEMLSVEKASVGFLTKIVGGTRDLSAGQLVDRTGVMLGLSFPAGAPLEGLAAEFMGKIPRKPVKAEDGYVHLSGMENYARALFEKEGDKSLCAAFVLRHITDVLIALSRYYREEHGPSPLLFAGGVMSNAFIRCEIEKEISDAYFAAPAFSADNAAGIALLAAESFAAEQ